MLLIKFKKKDVKMVFIEGLGKPSEERKKNMYSR
jgi:hypothetical protein